MQNIIRADGFAYNTGVADIVKQLLDIQPPETAIDIGAGAGRNVSFLLEHGCRVVAVECGPESLSILRELANDDDRLEVIDSTLQALRVERRFDAVLCNMTLHFLDRVEIPGAIAKLRSLVNRGGYICISSLVDCRENVSLPDKFTFRFAPGELRGYFEDWDVVHYAEDFPVPSARALNSDVNDGKGYKSARMIAQRPNVG